MSDIFLWLISITTTPRKRVLPGLPTPILKYDLISTAGYVAAVVAGGWWGPNYDCDTQLTALHLQPCLEPRNDFLSLILAREM